MSELINPFINAALPGIKKNVFKYGGKLIAGGLVLGFMAYFGKEFVDSIPVGGDENSELDDFDGMDELEDV
jgi:hypothetical protein